jgi:hypothetical protein
VRIYSKTDRIKVKIDEVVFTISPLSYKQKIEVQSLFTSGKQFEGSILSIRMAVKDIEGVEDAQGNAYKLKFENELISEDCIDDILNIENSMKLQLTCAELINGIPKEIIHPITGEVVKGINFLNNKEKDSKKKSR